LQIHSQTATPTQWVYTED